FARMVQLMKAIVAAATMLASCSSSSKPVARVTVEDIVVEIGAVELGAYCTPPAATEESEAQQRSCEPGSVTLSVHSGKLGQAVKVERVEVRDGAKMIGTLAIDKPTIWTTAGAYETWDQTIGANQAAQINYTLGGVDWSKVEGGRDAQYTRQFQVTVVIAIGATRRTVEKTVGTFPEPMFET
ncbi:MAG: hypothetical protein ABI867_17745, partial [Kofleriaceae bacterium]